MMPGFLNEKEKLPFGLAASDSPEEKLLRGRGTPRDNMNAAAREGMRLFDKIKKRWGHSEAIKISNEVKAELDPQGLDGLEYYLAKNELFREYLA
ncbi:hypothetical protein EHM76_07350 [bacterium]|nr:MAG: hypothetical protein EHM76_07350 [bacterium]